MDINKEVTKYTFIQGTGDLGSSISNSASSRQGSSEGADTRNAER